MFFFLFSNVRYAETCYPSQKASETAQSITAATSSSLASAQSRVASLSDNMVVELDKLQKSAASLAASLQTSWQSSASQIQSQIPQIHQSYADLSAALSSTANELTSIITNQDLAFQEKVGRFGREVRERVQPLLESVKKGISEVLARSEPQVDVPNGNGGH
jgi:DNA anti-recombination protein RmuC